MNRWVVAGIAALCMTGLYRVYSHVLVPLTQPRSATVERAAEEQTDFQPPLFQKTASQYFADTPWTRQAVIQWQRTESSFLFAEHLDHDPTGDVRTIKVAPVAMLWHDPQRPQAAPYRIIADEALIQFQNNFLGAAIDLANADTGRIVAATLAGHVHIDGPDGLAITGANFKFSEVQTQLYSDEPIEFRYGPTPENDASIHGHAGRIVLNLIPAQKPILGDVLPLIAGVASIRLNKAIDLRIQFKQRGAPVQASIRCAGDFEFDFQQLEATFRDHVEVRQFADPLDLSRVTEELLSESLLLNFERGGNSAAPGKLPLGTLAPLNSDSAADSAGLFDDLNFRELIAFGRLNRQGLLETPAVIRSAKANLSAAGEEIRFNAPAREALLRDRRSVRVEQGTTLLFSPSIRVQQDEQGNLARLECTGAGQLYHRDPRFGDEPLDVSWKGGVQALPIDGGKLQRLELRDSVELLLPGRLGLAAEQLRLWIDPVLARQLGEGDQPRSESMPLHRVEAAQDVRLLTPDLQVRQADSITVVMTPGTLSSNSSFPNILQTGGPAERQATAAAKTPLAVEAEHLTLNVTHDPRSAQVEVLSVHGAGMTRITREANATPATEQSPVEGALSLVGRDMLLTNAGDHRQAVSVAATLNERGDIIRAAELRVGEVTIQGARLEFDRASNIARVKGMGRLQIPVHRDLNGEPLEKPAVLSITWHESMSFDGLTANFLEDVNTSLESHQANVSELSCANMRVTLNRRLDFADPRPDTKNLQIVRILCQHAVKLDAYEWSGTKLIGKRLANLAEFEINQESGDFRGQGPGIIQAWSLGDRVQLAPATSQANQPVETAKPQWRYTSVRFAGQIAGNVHQKQAELQERVNLLSAPVENAGTVFVMEQLDEPTEQAEHAALLYCDRLRITQRPRSSGQGSFLELLAYDVPELEGAVQLEGHNFWASANELSFDEQSETFVLRGRGQDANLRFMDQTGKWLPPSRGQSISFTPSQRKVSFDRTSGVSGGF